MKGISNRMDIQTVMGERIRTRRKALGMTQTSLAEKLAVLQGADEPKTQKTISHWENGTNTISNKDIQDLTQVLKCDVAYLFGDTPIHSPTKEVADVVSATGLSPIAVECIQRLNERSDSRAYIDLLSCLLTSVNLEYLLGLLESYLTEEKLVTNSTDSMVKIEVMSKELALFSASHTLGNMLDEISDVFSLVPSTKARVDSLFEKKIKEMEADSNGKKER